jgi:hypothetical protein
LKLGLSKGPNTVGLCVSLPTSPEDGNRPNFLNVVFSTCLESRTMAMVRDPSDSEYRENFVFPSLVQ